jgi:hypothetical protein
MDGTWVMDTVRRDAGPDFLAENWGHWIFVFDRGRFADTQENAQACTWGYGTYTVGGDHLRLLFAGGGGIAPADAANKPGEAFAFSVSAYRGTLTLRPVKGAISPRNFRVHPWQRLGEPTRSRFSRRCPPPAQALG